MALDSRYVAGLQGVWEKVLCNIFLECVEACVVSREESWENGGYSPPVANLREVLEVATVNRDDHRCGRYSTAMGPAFE